MEPGERSSSSSRGWPEWACDEGVYLVAARSADVLVEAMLTQLSGERPCALGASAPVRDPSRSPLPAARCPLGASVPVRDPSHSPLPAARYPLGASAPVRDPSRSLLPAARCPLPAARCPLGASAPVKDPSRSPLPRHLEHQSRGRPRGVRLRDVGTAYLCSCWAHSAHSVVCAPLTAPIPHILSLVAAAGSRAVLPPPLALKEAPQLT